MNSNGRFWEIGLKVIAAAVVGIAVFVGIDRSIFGKLKVITDRDYYTNSFHVPVYYKTSVNHKMEI